MTDPGYVVIHNRLFGLSGFRLEVCRESGWVSWRGRAIGKVDQDQRDTAMWGDALKLHELETGPHPLEGVFGDKPVHVGLQPARMERILSVELGDESEAPDGWEFVPGSRSTDSAGQWYRVGEKTLDQHVEDGTADGLPWIYRTPGGWLRGDLDPDTAPYEPRPFALLALELAEEKLSRKRAPSLNELVPFEGPGAVLPAVVSEHGPCVSEGRRVSEVVQEVFGGGGVDDIVAWLLARLEHGVEKYGTPLRQDWPRAREALREELADAVVYALADGDLGTAEDVIRLLIRAWRRGDADATP